MIKIEKILSNFHTYSVRIFSPTGPHLGTFYEIIYHNIAKVRLTNGKIAFLRIEKGDNFKFYYSITFKINKQEYKYEYRTDKLREYNLINTIKCHKYIKTNFYIPKEEYRKLRRKQIGWTKVYESN